MDHVVVHHFHDRHDPNDRHDPSDPNDRHHPSGSNDRLLPDRDDNTN